MSTHHKNEFNYAFNFSSFICERDSWITFQLVNIQVMGRRWRKSTTRPVFSAETWSHPGEQETSEWNSRNGQSLLQWRGRQFLQQQLYQKKVSGIYNLIKLCKLSLVFIRPDKWEWLHVQTEYVSVPPAWSPWWSIMNSSSSGSFLIPAPGEKMSRGKFWGKVLLDLAAATDVCYCCRLHYYRLKVFQDSSKTSTKNEELWMSRL